jgi:hypothetical protein
MKKLIILMLAISSYANAFNCIPDQVIDGKCENADVKFKLCSRADSKAAVFARIKFKSKIYSAELNYVISFLDADGFCWHKEPFSSVTNGAGAEHLWNDMIVVPTYAWDCISTKIETLIP